MKIKRWPQSKPDACSFDDLSVSGFLSALFCISSEIDATSENDFAWPPVSFVGGNVVIWAHKEQAPDSAQLRETELICMRKCLEEISHFCLLLSTSPGSKQCKSHLDIFLQSFSVEMATPRAKLPSCQRDLEFYAFDISEGHSASSLSALLQDILLPYK